MGDPDLRVNFTHRFLTAQLGYPLHPQPKVVVLVNLSLPLLNSSTTDGGMPAPTTSAQDTLMDSPGRFQLTPPVSFVIP